ncbi:MAG: AbrB/MazE/SpoVT family DNA-binding domain-containing protein [Candidatus Omnitrophica bacterium]|nr:AbrB/MazE/SpoVT family DNA-binding domain-containing protein [Candidatus Omnitrophota bacterium]
MNTMVQKWGNSLALRIPRSVARDIHLRQGSVVDIALIAGKIVVKPTRRQHYTLTQLLRGVTKGNRHTELDWGGRVGQEAW